MLNDQPRTSLRNYYETFPLVYCHYYVYTDNFILNGDGETYYIQLFSNPLYRLRVDSNIQLSLTEGVCDVVPSPPGTDTGIMLYLEVYNFWCYSIV